MHGSVLRLFYGQRGVWVLMNNQNISLLAFRSILSPFPISSPHIHEKDHSIAVAFSSSK